MTEVERVARAIVGPMGVGLTREKRDRLREIRWNALTEQERGLALQSAQAAINAILLEHDYAHDAD